MSWNYRVVKLTYNKGKPYQSIGYEIREAYYNKDGSIWGMTEDNKGVYGDSIKDLSNGIKWMRAALKKDVIDLDTYVFANPDFDNNDTLDELENTEFEAALEDKDIDTK